MGYKHGDRAGTWIMNCGDGSRDIDGVVHDDENEEQEGR
jgi:hypothetical protein